MYLLLLLINSLCVSTPAYSAASKIQPTPVIDEDTCKHLTAACLKNRLEKVESLLKIAAADYDNYGLTPIHAITLLEDQNKHISLYKTFSTRFEKEEKCRRANCPSTHGILPLTFAVLFGSPALTAQILADGANPFVAIKPQEKYSINKGFGDYHGVIEKLAQSPANTTPLQLAIRGHRSGEHVQDEEEKMRNREIIKLLLAAIKQSGTDKQ